MLPRPWVKPKFPAETSTSDLNLRSGLRVLMLSAPAVVFLPNRVPCGPRSTVICLMSSKSEVSIPGREM